MKIQEIIIKSDAELKMMLLELKEKRHVLQFSKAAKKIKNPNEIKNVKKDIARILTVLTNKNHAK